MTNQPDRSALIAALASYIRMKQRENPRYSRAQLARDVGVAKSTISDIMNGKTKNISTNTLSALLYVVNNTLVAYRTLYPHGLQDSTTVESHDLPPDIIEMYRSNPERIREMTELFSKMSPLRQARALDFLRGLGAGEEQD